MNSSCISTSRFSHLGFLAVLAASALAAPGFAYAWGDEGHEIVAQIADHYLSPDVRTKINALLATDTSGLTDQDIAHEATWADKYRDSDRTTTHVHYNQTHNWHFVDMELAQPNLDTACFGHPAIKPGSPASEGPPRDCVVDKIDQFIAELKSPDTAPPERLQALQFLLHLVGDVHQPLHASDDHDAGGNSKKVSAQGLHAGKLHHYWDTEFVAQLGTDPTVVAQQLVSQITPDQKSAWSQGSASDWAQESFQIAKDQVYGKLPAPDSKGTYALDPEYVQNSTQIAGVQLSKAGVRLAAILNDALLPAGTVTPGPGVMVDRIFVIMLENHSQSSVIGDSNAPFLNQLAKTYALASNYYGVTHPSLPNYIAATSGSNWFINNDNPANRFDHTNLVDQLEEHHIPWGAYMDAMPSAGYLGDYYPSSTVRLYASKHNPFVLYDDIRNNPARLANIKPYDQLSADLNGQHPPSFVWISPDQCNDMHGGVSEVPGHPETPCPASRTKDDANDTALKAKADAFVKQAVTTIMNSHAWTNHSVIFIVTDESDFVEGNAATDSWESTEHCCDSPVLPDGYAFLGSDGKPDKNVWHGVKGDFTYGGGLIPAVIVSPAGPQGYVGTTPYNHYSLLRTIEEVWDLGYLGNASDAAQVHSMVEFLGH